MKNASNTRPQTIGADNESPEIARLRLLRSEWQSELDVVELRFKGIANLEAACAEARNANDQVLIRSLQEKIWAANKAADDNGDRACADRLRKRLVEVDKAIIYERDVNIPLGGATVRVGGAG